MPRARVTTASELAALRRRAVEMRKAGASLATIANACGRSRNWAFLVTDPSPVKQRTYACHLCKRSFTVKAARRPERCPLCHRYKWGKPRQVNSACA